MLAWLWWIGVLTGMYAWARWAVQGEPDRLLTALLTLGLSFGSLSLIAFLVGWFGLSIDWRSVTILYVILCAAGWIVYGRWRRAKPANPPSAPETPSTAPAPLGWLRKLAIGVVILMAALIVFNAVYWPIGTDDALAIYGFYGKLIAASGQLPALHPGALYETYPMALPLSEALIFQAAGWADSHLAALAPALLSIGTLGIAFLIGRTLVDRTVGVAAAVLIALTPLVAYWASASYTDLPAAFFYGFAWLFAIRYHRFGHLRDAILCGIMAGLAAWTKNSALLIVESLGLWVLWRHTIGAGGRIRVTTAAMSIAADGLRIGVPFVLICGGWYARAEWQAGWIVPPTGWTFAAQRTIGNLFPYLTDSRALPVGIIFTLGVLIVILWAVRSVRAGGRAFVPLTLLISTLPFMLIWYLLFSYEDRFLLLLIALVAVQGGVVIHLIALWVGHLTPHGQRAARAIAAIAILVTLIPAGAAAVLYKPDLLRQPLANEATKQTIRFGGSVAIAAYLQAHPPATCTIATDTLLPYLAFPSPVIVNTTLLTPPIRLDGCQLIVIQPGETLPASLQAVPLIMVAGGYRLYGATNVAP